MCLADTRRGCARQSDEYSFVLKKDSTLYGRREAKLVSVLTSLFTSAYVLAWSRRMGEGTPLRQAPCFDGRAVAYPSDAILRDYLAWRQVDAHINNQYNTVFWALVAQGGETPAAAQTLIRGTDAAWKNETLHTRFSINYNDLPAMFRKGSVVTRVRQSVVVKVKEVRGRLARAPPSVGEVLGTQLISAACIANHCPFLPGERRGGATGAVRCTGHTRRHHRRQVLCPAARAGYQLRRQAAAAIELRKPSLLFSHLLYTYVISWAVGQMKTTVSSGSVSTSVSPSK